MLFAFLTLFAWTLGSFSGARCAGVMGGFAANRLRIASSLLVLSVVIAVTGTNPGIPHAFWFLLAGLLHLGLGDVGLYTAYHHLGPRLAVLVGLCGAPLVTFLVEGLVWNHWPGLWQCLLALAIMIGVIIALAPDEKSRLKDHQSWTTGLIAGIIAALGAGSGSAVTSHAYKILGGASKADFAFHTSAMGLRLVGGIFGLLVLGVVFWRKTPFFPLPEHRPLAWRWMPISVLMGPILGVACYHLALAQVPEASLVQAVIALLPVAVIPLSWSILGDRPSPRALIGAAIGVAAAVGLALVR